MKNLKNQTGIWIDTSKAVIVSLYDGKESITEIESDVENRIYHYDEGNKGTFSGTHHGSSETKFDERKKNQLNDFFKKIISNIKQSDEVYIFGPSETKTKLKQKIYDEKSIDITKLKAVETFDSNVTTNQIVASVKKFYKV